MNDWLGCSVVRPGTTKTEGGSIQLFHFKVVQSIPLIHRFYSCKLAYLLKFICNPKPILMEPSQLFRYAQSSKKFWFWEFFLTGVMWHFTVVFHLHFPDNSWYGASFQGIISQLHIQNIEYGVLNRDMSIQILCPLFN